MFAERANEISRQILMRMDVAADFAYPALGLFIRRFFDILMVIVISRRWNRRENFAVCNICEEQCMAAQIDRMDHLGRNISVGAVCDVWDIVLSKNHRKIFKLIDISACLETKVFECVEFSILAKDRHIEFSCFQHHVVGVILFIDCDGDPVRGGCHLLECVSNTSVEFIAIPGGKYEQPVADISHYFLVHDRFLSKTKRVE